MSVHLESSQSAVSNSVNCSGNPPTTMAIGVRTKTKGKHFKTYGKQEEIFRTYIRWKSCGDVKSARGSSNYTIFRPFFCLLPIIMQENIPTCSIKLSSSSLYGTYHPFLFRPANSHWLEESLYICINIVFLGKLGKRCDAKFNDKIFKMPSEFTLFRFKFRSPFYYNNETLLAHFLGHFIVCLSHPYFQKYLYRLLYM